MLHLRHGCHDHRGAFRRGTARGRPGFIAPGGACRLRGRRARGGVALGRGEPTGPRPDPMERSKSLQPRRIVAACMAAACQSPAADGRRSRAPFASSARALRLRADGSKPCAASAIDRSKSGRERWAAARACGKRPKVARNQTATKVSHDLNIARVTCAA